jgi:putative redox protein
MELMLMGLGGCMGYDVLTILRRMRMEVTGYRLHLEGKRADDPPAVYTEVRLEHVIAGKDLEPEKVERALALAADRYCSAWAMFAKTAKLTNSYRIEGTS